MEREGRNSIITLFSFRSCVGIFCSTREKVEEILDSRAYNSIIPFVWEGES